MEKTSATIRGDQLSLALKYLFFMSCVLKRSTEQRKNPVAGFHFDERVFETLDVKLADDKPGCWPRYGASAFSMGSFFFGPDVLRDGADALFNIDPTVNWILLHTMNRPLLSTQNISLLQERLTRYLCMVASGEIAEETLGRHDG